MAAVESPKAPWEAWRLNMAEKVAAFDPDAEPPWSIDPLVIPGSLIVVAGQGGGGKTWVLHEASHVVASGAAHTGMRRRNGACRALIIDAEMGEWLTVQRFAQQRYSTDVEVLDATGRINLTVPEQREQLYAAIVALEPDFIGLDSLSALTAGADENGRDIAQFVGWLRNVCIERRIAGMLLHHAGWKEERTRGSSAIRDSCDAVWYLRAIDDGETPADESSLRELTCRGVALKAPRWGPPPHPLYLRLRESGGLAAADKPDAPPPKRTLKQERMEVLREAVAAGEIKSKQNAVDLLNMGTQKAAVYAMLRDIGAHKPDDAAAFTLNGDHPAI